MILIGFLCLPLFSVLFIYLLLMIYIMKTIFKVLIISVLCIFYLKL
jgi:hypothetical protein